MWFDPSYDVGCETCWTSRKQCQRCRSMPRTTKWSWPLAILLTALASCFLQILDFLTKLPPFQALPQESLRFRGIL